MLFEKKQLLNRRCKREKRDSRFVLKGSLSAGLTLFETTIQKRSNWTQFYLVLKFPNLLNMAKCQSQDLQMLTGSRILCHLRYEDTDQCSSDVKVSEY